MAFKFLKDLALAGTNRLAGHTDLLEAVVAGAALVASADGTIDDSEVITTLDTLKNNATISGAFDLSTIERTADKMFERAKGGRSGRMGLYKEIEDVAKNASHADTVMYAILDVADNDGIDDKEMAVLRTISQRLGVSLDKYLNS